jgi:hypothetical protein
VYLQKYKIQRELDIRFELTRQLGIASDLPPYLRGDHTSIAANGSIR